MAKKTKRQRKAEVVKEQGMTAKQKLAKAKILIDSGEYSAGVALVTNMEGSLANEDDFVQTLVKGYDGLIAQQYETQVYEKAYATYQKRIKYSRDGVSHAVTLSLLVKCQLIDEALAYYRSHHQLFLLHKKQDFDALSALIPHVFLQNRLSRKKDADTYLYQETILAEHLFKKGFSGMVEDSNSLEQKISATGIYRDLRLIIKGLKDYSIVNMNCFDKVKDSSPFKELAVVLCTGLLPKFMHIEYLTLLSKAGMRLYCQLNKLSETKMKALMQLLKLNLESNAQVYRYVKTNLDAFTESQIRFILAKSFDYSERDKLETYCAKYGALSTIKAAKMRAIESLKLAKKTHFTEDAYDCMDEYEALVEMLSEQDITEAKCEASLILFDMVEEFQGLLDQDERDEYYESAIELDHTNLTARLKLIESKLKRDGYRNKEFQKLVESAYLEHPDELNILDKHLLSLNFQDKNEEALDIISQRFQYPVEKLKSTIFKCVFFDLIKKLKSETLKAADIDEYLSAMQIHFDHEDKVIFALLKNVAPCLLMQDENSDHSLLKFSFWKGRKTSAKLKLEYHDYFKTAENFYCLVVLAALFGYTSFANYPKELAEEARQQHLVFIPSMRKALFPILKKLGGVLGRTKYQKFLAPALIALLDIPKINDEQRLELCFLLEDLELLSYLTPNHQKKILAGKSKLILAAQCYYRNLKEELASDAGTAPFECLMRGESLDAHLRHLPKDHELEKRIIKLMASYARKLEDIKLEFSR